MPPKAAPRRAPARRPGAPESTSTTPAGAGPTQNAPESQGTGTPGPAGRPSVQRLQSLKRRPGSGSITPSGRPPSTLSGEPAKPTLKYKPRAVGRRSKEERDAIEKLEQERHNERLKEAAAIQRGRGGPALSRGRGGFRGRGGPMGMGVGGPLGAGAGRRGRGGAMGSSAPGRGMNRTAISGGYPQGANGFVNDEFAEARFSIDQINFVDSDDEFNDGKRDTKGKMPIRERREKGLRPVRVERHPHEERVISVNMESSSNRSAALRQKAEEAKTAEEKGQAPHPQVPDEPRVKEEPADEDEAMTETLSHVEDDGLLPTQKVRVRRKLSTAKQTAEEGAQVQELEPELAPRDPRELLRTNEEIDEYDRHMEDLEQIKHLFLTEKAAEPEKPVTEPETEIETETPAEAQTTTAPETTTDTAEENDPPGLLGQLFLMQFPPMTPNLTLPGAADNQPPAEPASAPAEPAIKREGDDVEIVETAPAAPAAPAAPSTMVTAATDWTLPAGRVGKLNVHRSGRMTMDWGGISFELDRAASVDFVQEALIVQSGADDAGAEVGQNSENCAYSMGQLCGKFTVTPNWDEML
ncbi:hypothetical protein NUU61_004318 [Penicillium alfredii]|uniref:DNA-directed RNA polymerase III RPC4 n=1 Tax=Penicillium alfredii TaxID=1506179 RepID=A0A9W9FKV9_9EURO|nr:uncharacterized protein NUU61_004318 [Penicillium alfredii]KAJ5102096.1 hypothetical protein NUU61_004318 [Penicillium alfredii]